MYFYTEPRHHGLLPNFLFAANFLTACSITTCWIYLQTRCDVNSGTDVLFTACFWHQQLIQITDRVSQGYGSKIGIRKQSFWYSVWSNVYLFSLFQNLFCQSRVIITLLYCFPTDKKDFVSDLLSTYYIMQIALFLPAPHVMITYIKRITEIYQKSYKLQKLAKQYMLKHTINQDF